LSRLSNSIASRLYDGIHKKTGWEGKAAPTTLPIPFSARPRRCPRPEPFAFRLAYYSYAFGALGSRGRYGAGLARRLIIASRGRFSPKKTAFFQPPPLDGLSQRECGNKRNGKKQRKTKPEKNPHTRKNERTEPGGDETSH
jgi:hypothetical protein